MLCYTAGKDETKCVKEVNNLRAEMLIIVSAMDPIMTELIRTNRFNSVLNIEGLVTLQCSIESQSSLLKEFIVLPYAISESSQF